MMKAIWFGLAKYASDEYLKREDLSRWEIWMGRYILLVSLGFLAMLLFDFPLVAILVLLGMMSVVVLINFIRSLPRVHKKKNKKKKKKGANKAKGYRPLILFCSVSTVLQKDFQCVGSTARGRYPSERLNG